MSIYVSVWPSSTVQILYTSYRHPGHIFHIICNQFTVFMVNDVSTLLFKFAITVISSLQQNQELVQPHGTIKWIRPGLITPEPHPDYITPW
jgi:hypothetical protein